LHNLLATQVVVSGKYNRRPLLDSVAALSIYIHHLQHFSFPSALSENDKVDRVLHQPLQHTQNTLHETLH